MIKQITLLLLVVLTISSCKQQNYEVLNHDIIKTESDRIFDKLVKVRRDFHKYPELAKEEKRTQAIIKTQLLQLGLDVITDTYGNSVIGVLKGGKKGKNIAWRADMDAIPQDLLDEVPFKSTFKGVQHGCGHDVHMAIALGIAEVFSKYRHSISGNIYFIFQPEEETFLGAKGMIKNGLFSTIKLDEIYAAHVTAFDVGEILAKSNEMYAYQKRIQISFDKKMKKEDAIDLYKEIKLLMNRMDANSQPWNLTNVFDNKLGISNPNTSFKNYCFMDENAYIEETENAFNIYAFMYETNSSKADSIIPKVNNLISNGPYKNLLTSISFIQKNPTVLNDENLTMESLQTLSKIYGDDLVNESHGQIPYFNDDFFYFQKEVPGVYFLLGGSNKDKGLIAMNHAPNFRVDEECIRSGVSSFSSLLLERLNKLD